MITSVNCVHAQCFNTTYQNERKSEQAHIPHTPTLLENAVYNEWQFQAKFQEILLSGFRGVALTNCVE